MADNNFDVTINKNISTYCAIDSNINSDSDYRKINNDNSARNIDNQTFDSPQLIVKGNTDDLRYYIKDFFVGERIILNDTEEIRGYNANYIGCDGFILKICHCTDKIYFIYIDQTIITIHSESLTKSFDFSNNYRIKNIDDLSYQFDDDVNNLIIGSTIIITNYNGFIPQSCGQIGKLVKVPDDISQNYIVRLQSNENIEVKLCNIKLYNIVSNDKVLVVGSRMKVVNHKTTERKYPDLINTFGYIISHPLHPNTWYDVLIDGKDKPLKLQRACIELVDKHMIDPYDEISQISTMSATKVVKKRKISSNSYSESKRSNNRNTNSNRKKRKIDNDSNYIINNGDNNLTYGNDGNNPKRYYTIIDIFNITIDYGSKSRLKKLSDYYESQRNVNNLTHCAYCSYPIQNYCWNTYCKNSPAFIKHQKTPMSMLLDVVE